MSKSREDYEDDLITQADGLLARRLTPEQGKAVREIRGALNTCEWPWKALHSFKKELKAIEKGASQ